MTSQNVITAVRQEIKDEDAGRYRWEDAVLFRALTEALRRLQMLRPDVFVDEDGDAQAVVQVDALDATMPVSETYTMPLTWMVCATVLASDGEDEANEKRADGYMVRAMNAVMGP